MLKLCDSSDPGQRWSVQGGRRPQAVGRGGFDGDFMVIKWDLPYGKHTKNIQKTMENPHL